MVGKHNYTFWYQIFNILFDKEFCYYFNNIKTCKINVRLELCTHLVMVQISTADISQLESSPNLFPLFN